MILNRVEVLLFLLLPLQKSLDSLYTKHFSMNPTYFFFLFIHSSTQFLHSPCQIHDVQLMAIVSLLMSIAAFTFFTEEWPALALGVKADINKRTFVMLGTVEW